MKRVIGMFALGALVAMLCGCSGKDEYKALPPPATPPAGVNLPNKNLPSGEKIVFGDHGDPGLAAAVGANNPVTTSPRKDTDYIEKADIYWKFNYLKQILETGVTPPDLPKQVEQLKLRADRTQEDENKPILKDIVTALERGMEAQKEEVSLRAHGVDPNTITWGAGRSAIETDMRNHIALQRMGMGDTTTRLSPGQMAALDYEQAHHSSPDQVRRMAFLEACEKTTLLGHKLGLDKRRANTPPGMDTID